MGVVSRFLSRGGDIADLCITSMDGLFGERLLQYCHVSCGWFNVDCSGEFDAHVFVDGKGVGNRLFHVRGDCWCGYGVDIVHGDWRGE